jgi:hypothetical protein
MNTIMKPQVLIKGMNMECFNQIRNYQLPKKNSSPRNQLHSELAS